MKKFLCVNSGLGGHHDSYILALVENVPFSDRLQIVIPKAFATASEGIRACVDRHRLEVIQPGSFSALWLQHDSPLVQTIVQIARVIVLTITRRPQKVLIMQADGLSLVLYSVFKFLMPPTLILQFRSVLNSGSSGSSIRRRVEKLFINRWLSRVGNQIAFLDPYVCTYVKTLFPGCENRIRLCPDPVEAGRSTSTGRNILGLAIAPDARVFLLFGVIDERKGLERLTEVLLRLAPEVRQRCLIAIVGPVQPHYLAKCQNALNLLQSKGIRTVLINKYIEPDLAQQYFSAADAVLLLYKNHVGMSSVLVRAALAGKPVLAQAEGLIGRLVADRELGLCFGGEENHRLMSAIGRFVKEGSVNNFDTEKAYAFARWHTPANFAKVFQDFIEE